MFRECVEGALELRTRVMTGSIRDWSRVRMPGSLISCALLSCRGEHGGQSSQLSRTEPNRAHTDTESERIKGDNRDMTLPTVRQLLLLCFFGFFGCWSSTGGYPSVFHKSWMDCLCREYYRSRDVFSNNHFKTKSVSFTGWNHLSWKLCAVTDWTPVHGAVTQPPVTLN